MSLVELSKNFPYHYLSELDTDLLNKKHQAANEVSSQPTSDSLYP